MKASKEDGFSLIELLCVVVIIGVIAAIAIPSLRKSIHAAENGAVFGSMRTIASTQVSFYTANNRFGRIDELNNQMNHAFGVDVGASQVEKNQFLYEMVPAAPTDTELKDEYTVTATRTSGNDTTIYKYEVTQTGQVCQIEPTPVCQ